MQKLDYLKKAITEVTWAMHEEEVAKKVVEEAAEVDDQLGWTIRWSCGAGSGGVRGIGTNWGWLHRTSFP